MMMLFAMPLTVVAQGVVMGEVTAVGGTPVAYATVGVMDSLSPYGTTTDGRGRYRLQLRSTDTLTLRISSIGYTPREYRVVLHKGEVLVLDCELAPSATVLDEVAIRDNRIRTSPFTQIDVQRLESTVGPQEGVETLLKTLPDVASNNELSSQYSVRGGSFDENLVYINGVEIYRPQLVRSGQQEGLSIINPDLVDHLMFSPGGFDATYGDKLSSVLDIYYSRPVERRFRLSASLLGGSASAQGRVGECLAYSVGFRQHNNRYLLNSLSTQGNYTTSYTDLQGILSYKVNDRLDVTLLTVWTRNVYGLIPSTSTITYGSFNQALQLNIYFDGEERDRYTTLLGAMALDYHPADDLRLRWITSAQYNREQEHYDLQSQYFLYEVGLGESADTNLFDRGVGTFLEHARNRLNLGIYATEVRASRDVALGQWNAGLKAQYETVRDVMREWKWVDSAGYAFPTTHPTPGVDDTVPYNPLLQLFCNADNTLQTFRTVGYLQRDLNFVTTRESELRIVAGLRTQYYTTYLDTPEGRATPWASHWVLSPRAVASLKPATRHDILYRLAAGIYQQPTLYREMRRADGTLLPDQLPQCSYQATGSFDWCFRIPRIGDSSGAGVPLRLTADLFYKYVTHLVPYTIDNMRIRYNPDQQAVAYVAGASVRVTGDFVPGLESWVSLSLLKTQEDIEGDGLSWIDRPTDQRFSVKLFLQDYIPTFPWWRMSLNFIYGSRLPVTFPNQQDRSTSFHLPPYYRVDWGNTIQLTRFQAIRKSAVGRLFTDLSLSLEVFNLFNYRNVVSFIWVSDYTSIYHAVPNYLTARQLNVKLTATF